MPKTAGLALLTLSFTLACGSGRQLQSISIQQTQNASEFQFVATGSFSAPPTTVRPLPVDWTIGLMAPPPPKYDYTLSPQPYVFKCLNSGPQVVVAFAPPNPDAPTNGSVSQVIQASATFTCP